MQRQAATAKGLVRRLRDLALEQVAEPRQERKVRHPLPTLLTALVTAKVLQTRSLRGAEQHTGECATLPETELGIAGRIADNTLGRILPRLRQADLVAGLQRLAKAEHRRGNLRPTALPWGTAAIDGKNVATVRWPDLCRVLGLAPAVATVAAVRTALARQFPEAQFCEPEQGAPYALLRVHTVTLVSSAAAVCLHVQPIPGHTNEIGALPALLQALQQGYAKTRLFQVLTTDAGNTSEATAQQTVAAHLHYFAQLKPNHHDLYAEAERVLGALGAAQAQASYADQQHGTTVTYEVWTYDLTDQGWLAWTHARQLVRVRRVVTNAATGAVESVGNRYYVSSQTPVELTAKTALDLSRRHWTCENGTHFPMDVELQEDQRRPSWTRHPHGLLAVNVLGLIALAILAVVRQLSRFGYSKETPSWSQVAQHYLKVLCGTLLDTAAKGDV